MFRTTLSVAIGQTDNKLVVSSTAYAAISLNAYLELRYGTYVEVVKLIDKRNGLLVVSRARDYTEALAFPAGTAVTQVLTEEGIRKQITKGPQLKLYFSGGTFGSYNHIGYYSLDIKYEGVNYTIGSGNNISIGREENAYGCCDGDAEARKGFRYTYYTSTLYPYDVKDAARVAAYSTPYLRSVYQKLDYSIDAAFTAAYSTPALKSNIISYAQAEFDAATGTWNNKAEYEAILATGVSIPTLKDTVYNYPPESLAISAYSTPITKEQLKTTYNTDMVAASAYSTPTLG